MKKVLHMGLLLTLTIALCLLLSPSQMRIWATGSEATVPTLTLRYPSLSFEGEVFCNVYFSLENPEQVEQLGLLTFDTELPGGTVADAAAVIPGTVYDDATGLYMARTGGIPAKNLGDAVYFKAYAKLTDGSYAYSELRQYSALDYAADRLANSSDEGFKALCVAMLNYGASAQQYFAYKTDCLMNAGLTSGQLALVEPYRSGMVDTVVSVDSAKEGVFAYNAAGYSERWPSVSFEGAFGINYYFIPALTVDGEMTLFYWDMDTYNTVSVLTAENASGSMVMTPNSTGTYEAKVGGIAAKEIDSTVFVAGVYESDGVSYATGVLAYSLGGYCTDRIQNGSEGMRAFAEATAVYGYYAKRHFDALAPLVQKLQSLQSDSTLTISGMSDTHYTQTDTIAAEKLETAGKMGRLPSLCNVDLVVNLGDMIPGKGTKDLALSDLRELMAAVGENVNAPVYYLRGNHDDNGWYSYGGFGGSYREDEMINDVEWMELISDYAPEDMVTDANRPNGGYGYYDHEASKIRVFLLNSDDLPYILESDGTYRYNSYAGHAFSNEQINFVAEALMFADKEEPSQWAALFISHVPLDTTNNDGYRFGIKDALIRGHEYMLAVINAYQKGSSFAASGNVYNASLGDVAEDFNVSVEVDYSANGTGNVIGFISGHTHTDNFSRSVGFENSLSRGYNFLSLFGATGFANYVVDRENNKITFVKYGKAWPDKTGSVVDAPDTGSIESGEWSVNITKNIPTGENLFAGYSEVWSEGGYTFDSNTQLDLNTMEVTSLSTVSRSSVALKVIPVKPFTRYALPADFSGSILAFGTTGVRSSYLTPTVGEDYKWIQTGIRQYYIAITLHTGTYKNYENFQIQEIFSGMEF